VILRVLLYGGLCLLLGLAVSVWLLLATERGSLWLVQQANSETISLRGAQGSLASDLHLQGITIRTTAVTIEMQDVSLRLDLAALLIYRLKINHLDIGLMTVTRLPVVATEESQGAGFAGLPLRLDLSAVAVTQLDYAQGDSVYSLHDLQIEGYLDGLALNLQRYALTWQDYRLAGNLELFLRDPWHFSGNYQLATPWGEAKASISGSRQLINSRGVFQSLSFLADLDLTGAAEPLTVAITSELFDLSPYTIGVPELAQPQLAKVALRMTTDFVSYNFAGTAELRSESLPVLPMRIAGQYLEGELALTDFEVAAAPGRAALTGRYKVEGQQFVGQMQLEDMPLSVLMAFAPATVRAAVTLQGQVSTSGKVSFIERRLGLDLPQIKGVINNQALLASVSLGATDGKDLKLKLAAKVGDNELLAELDMLAQQLVVDLSGKQLGMLAPELRGEVQLHGTATQIMGQPQVKANLALADFGMGEYEVAALTAAVASQGTDQYRITFAAQGLQSAGTAVGDVQGAFSGSPRKQTGNLKWQLDKQMLETQISSQVTVGGGYNGWVPESGQIQFSQTLLTLPWGAWRGPATSLEYTPTRVQLNNESCWQSGTQGDFCVEQARLQDSKFEVAARLSGMPLAIANLPSAPKLSFEGKLGARVHVAGTLAQPKPQWQGQFSLSLPQGLLAWSEFVEDRAYIDVSGQGEINTYNLSAGLTAMSGEQHQLKAKLQLPDLRRPASFSVTANMQSRDVALLTAVLPFVANGRGEARAALEYSQSETLAAGAPSGSGGVAVSPQRKLKGELTLGPGVAALIPALNLEFTGLEFNAKATNERDIEFHGEVHSGAGQIETKGTSVDLFGADRQVRLQVQGEKFDVINRPELRLAASPDLTINVKGNETRVTGTLRIDSGRIEEKALNINSRARSQDVVLSTDLAAKSRAQVLDLDVNFVVGDQLQIVLYGLNAKVSGALRIRQSATRPRHVEGILNLTEGVFSRYGVEFQLERGRLIYSGSLTNPTVDVIARREIDTAKGKVTVSLVMSGPANDIQSRLVASPAMTEADALSYLILGQPLSGSTGSDGSMLANAALSFGLKKAIPITAEIQAKLGLDQLAVKGKDVDTAAIVAGKRLSRDLYLEYNYGLFSRIGGLLLNYQLSERLALQAQSGTADSLELIYTF
jgi:translocation and assembly module TamB